MITAGFLLQCLGSPSDFIVKRPNLSVEMGMALLKPQYAKQLCLQ